MTVSAHIFVMPGESLDSKSLPYNPNQPLKLGPGLRHLPPNTIAPTVAGQLCIDSKKNGAWVEFNGGRYIPAVGDLVIATIRNSSIDVYYAHLTDFTSAATLPQLSFEGANRKTRQQLTTGALVYARVSVANKHMDPELECVSQSTGKSNGLGPLIGGMLFTISLGMARRLMLPKPAEQGRVVVLDEFGAAGVSFEIAVGRNGKLWVDSPSVKTTLAIGKAIQETDFKHLEPEEQKKLAAKLVKNI